MPSRQYQNLVFDTIDEIARLEELSRIGDVFAPVIAQFGLTSFGIAALPPPGDGVDPITLTEIAPEGFRELYTSERFYLVDHIGGHARSAYEPFRYSEAPYDQSDAFRHKRFMDALELNGLGRGLIVPTGRPANIPACVWLAGKDPDLSSNAIRAIELICLFAANKARALSRLPNHVPLASKLTTREREALQWTAAGKTSWEIGSIFGLSERAVNKIIADAMNKLDAVTRTQAVATAFRLGEIEL